MIFKKTRQSALLIGLVCILSACSTTPPDEGTKDMAAITKQNSIAADYNVQLGVGYLQQGDMARSKRKLLLALDQAPNWPPAIDAMAYYLETTGDNKSAETYYLRAISVAPKDGSAHNNYGTYLCRTKRFQQADQQFMMAVQDPNYINTAEAYENAGLCAMQVPNNVTALAYFQKAIMADPKRPVSYLELSQLTFMQGNYPLAQQYFDNYSTLSPAMGPDALWLGIRLARQLGDPTTAGRFALQLQSKFPHSAENQQLMAASHARQQSTDEPS